MPAEKTAKKTKSNKTSEDVGKSMIRTGVLLILIALFILGAVFTPTIKEEINYAFKTRSEAPKKIVFDKEPGSNEIIPADEEFSIIIPKIGANSRVIQDVDPYNPREYQQKLTQGVAHAKGSSLPNKNGNTFLFAHSSDNFYNANRYNSVFYLINKMELDDKFMIVKDKEVYEYSVNEKVIVNPDQVEYLTDTAGNQKATLMTCWPPGTTLQRLIIVGELDSVTKL